MEIISISSDDDLSHLEENQPHQPPQLPLHQVSIDVASVSSADELSSVDSDIPLRRLKTRGSRTNVPIEVTSVSSDDSMSHFIVYDSSQPSSPPSAVRDIREEIRRAIRHIRNDDAAKEKSAAQMNVLIAVMTADTDLVITMKTGGGKSMSWMVPSVMDEEARSIVVCPFVSSLDEQHRTTAASGLRCHNYCISKVIPDNVQILFMQVEDCSSDAFAR
jgi:hypothetical protein